MVLVWNDHYCEVLEDNETYDRRYETVVRKLFLRWMVDDPSQFSTTSIQAAFQKFYRIESVSVDMINLTNSTDHKYVAEAYVSFKNSLEAHNAVNVNKFRPISKEVLKLVHADTWHQAERSDDYSNAMKTSDSEECFILKLNDHCLLKIFEFFDFQNLVELTEVCQLFRTLLKSLVFPKFKTFKFQIKTSSTSTGTTLGVVRKKLRCVGSHLNELDYEQTSLDCERVIEKIIQYTGPNLQILKLHLRSLDENHLHKLAPIFKVVNALEIRTNSECKLVNLLRNLCPNLVKLNICLRRGCVYDIQMATPWISIEHLTLEIFGWRNDVELPEQVMRMVKSLIDNVPSLKNFACNFITNGIIQTMAETMLNVHEISISMRNIHTGLQINRLETLRNLTHLTLNLGSTDILDPTLSYIETLSKFCQLKLIAVVTMYDYNDPNDIHWNDRKMPFVGITINRAVSTLSGCSVHRGEEKTLSFSININDVPSDSALFMNIVTVRASDNGNDPIQRALTSFFQHSNTFFRNLNKSLIVEDNIIRQHIEIGTFY